MTRIALLYSFIAISLIYSCKSEQYQSVIAYNELSDEASDDYDVHVMSLDGKSDIEISKNNGLDWTYNAYGPSLFVISDRDSCDRCFYLYETDARGLTFRKISNTRIADSWISSRKQGSELIIKPYGTAHEPFQIIDLQGNVLHSITSGLPYHNDPCFSPNGQSIAFRGALTENKQIEGHNDEIYTINIDGSNLLKVTNYPTSDTTARWYDYKAGPPRWNSKTNEISYSSYQKGYSAIYGLQMDSMKLRKITSDNINSVWHDVSADGRYLAYDGQLRTFKSDSSNYQIFIMDIESRSNLNLTPTKGVRQAPVLLQQLVTD